MAISPVSGVNPAANLTAMTPLESASGTSATGATSGTDAGNMFTRMLDGLGQVQNNADSLAQQAATGSLQDVQNYTIAATEASLATDLTVAVRNRAVDAFNEIMRMQI
jgi:flagellar hook-basal body complex protein FliE